jgi:Zn-dependent M28 family amino/carboxypeptidase
MKFLSRRRFFFILTLLVIVLLVIIFTSSFVSNRDRSAENQHVFNGERAMRDVQYQVALGPRLPESNAHAQAVEYIQTELRKAGWTVDIQETESMGHPIRNIIAKRGEGHPWIILGAHYDSRIVADRDPMNENQQLPVPGANDGASGVAALLEIARALTPTGEQIESTVEEEEGQLWLVFFDAEDNGNLPGWDWLLGSRAFVSQLEAKPDAVVVLDMIGDADLNIYLEKNSDPILAKQIWQHAERLGFSDQFINTEKYRIIDDHLPFIEAGISAVDLIDFDYPYWHTIADTPDKVSSKSLQIVGEVILSWLAERFDHIPLR